MHRDGLLSHPGDFSRRFATVVGPHADWLLFMVCLKNISRWLHSLFLLWFVPKSV
jgi:hypothetical protein